MNFFLHKCNWSFCNWIFNLISTTLNMNSSHAWDKNITWTCFETQNFTKLLCNLFSHNIVWACIMYVALCFVHLHSEFTNFRIYWILKHFRVNLIRKCWVESLITEIMRKKWSSNKRKKIYFTLGLFFKINSFNLLHVSRMQQAVKVFEQKKSN